MNRPKRSRASKVSAVASAPPSSVRKLSRKRWVLDEITRHYDIGHGSGEQLLDEAMPHGVRPIRLARIAQGFGEAFRHDVGSRRRSLIRIAARGSQRVSAGAGHRGGRGDESRREANGVHCPRNRGCQGDRGRLAFPGRHRRGKIRPATRISSASTNLLPAKRKRLGRGRRRRGMLAGHLALTIAAVFRARRSTSTSRSSRHDFSLATAPSSPSGSRPTSGAISCRRASPSSAGSSGSLHF